MRRVRRVELSEPENDTYPTGFVEPSSVRFSVQRGARVWSGIGWQILMDPRVAAVRIHERQRLLDVASRSNGQSGVDEVSGHLSADASVLRPCARKWSATKWWDLG